ncbi:hypothetical protein DXT99_07815 [Pontibacter diazotrophicus]|uniref:Uncharacterized protein n=1 Tax=Pontibacter diazotrophicus TaxID=1400979 RepID=A0A3D8LES4_9BACT|nr:hypothetical protein [Pontibacter diazotrophicus]RDV15887.1 hypothetical protein DXT99_07815 [Pontibacter diazotrophicus]
MVKNNFARFRSALLSQTTLLFMLLLFVVATSACSRREAIREESELGEEGEGEVPVAPYDGRLLGQVVFDTVEYIVSREELLQPFIREFGDGTVVDQVMIRKVQETKTDTPAYYLVGLGMRSGAFRSMALELDVAADKSLYLSSSGSKHMCQSGAGCGFCYFTFSGNKITGCECESRAPGNNCTHKFSERNSLLKDVSLRSERRRSDSNK